MLAMVTVTLFMAMSLNGYIARKNGEEDFLSQANWRSFLSLVDDAGVCIVGRRTLEAVEASTDMSFAAVKARGIVLTSKQNTAVPDGWSIATSPRKAIEIVQGMDSHRALLIGGAQTNAAFLHAGLVDRIIVNIEPILIDSGIPLVGKGFPDTELHLQGVEKLEGDIMQITYSLA